MATNLGCIWKKNLYGAMAPFKYPGSFVAGSTTAVKSGEILVLGAGTWAPLGSDASMSATIAVSDSEVRAGDLAGYRPIIVPRPGDVFEITLAAAAAPGLATALYYSSSQALTITAGTNIIGYEFPEGEIPLQGFQSVNPSYDATTTIRTVSKVTFVFKASVSYWAALNP